METKNVIIIGTSRCGKSTIANNIIGKDVFARNSGESSFGIETEKKNISGKGYKITVVDTPCLNSRNICKESIEAHLIEKKIEEINLIIFVIKAGRLTGVDKKLLNNATLIFSPSTLQSIAALVISHCEQYDETKRNWIIRDFKDDPYTKELAQSVGNGIITTGIPLVEDCNDTLFEDLEDSIKNDIAKLDDLVAKANERVDLNNLFRPTGHSYFGSCVIS